MFWDIIRDSTKLGLKAGTLLGGLYFPAIWAGYPLLTWIQTGHLSGTFGGEIRTGIGIVLLSSLTGALFGMVLGALNGLFLAVLTAAKPQNYLSQHWRQLAAAYAVFNLCGVSRGIYFIIRPYSDWPTFFMCIGAPTLLAAGAAVWAMARMAKWYREAAPPDADAPTLADNP